MLFRVGGLGGDDGVKAGWGQGAQLFPHGSDLKQCPEGCEEENRRSVRRVAGAGQKARSRLPVSFGSWTRQGPFGAGAYAVGRWGSCWPGSAGCPHRCYTGRGGGRAGSRCPGRPRDTPHTRRCYHSRRPQPPGRGDRHRGPDTTRHNVSILCLRGQLAWRTETALRTNSYVYIGLYSRPREFAYSASLILGTATSSASHEAQTWPL